jgi:predicted translin family RNA/ssDNA-binding protein
MEVESDTEGIHEVFSEYEKYLLEENERKEKISNAVKTVELESRRIYTILQSIHRPGADIQKVVVKCEDSFSKMHILIREVDSAIPDGSYWKYHHTWNNTLTWLSYMASATIYLKTDCLPDKYKVEELMGIVKSLKCLKLDIEEYLIGLCHLCSDLSRLAVNSVTNQDFQRPIKIADFMNSLYTGFRMLNLKNDNLRKKFDAIKYDLKKVEEVVYDLSIRGLSTQANPLMQSEDELEPPATAKDNPDLLNQNAKQEKEDNIDCD